MSGSADVGQPRRPSAYQEIGTILYKQFNRYGNEFPKKKSNYSQ